MNKLAAGNRTSARPSRTRLAATGIVSVAALGMLALPPATAHAAQSADCPSSALCLYSGQNFGGELLTFSSLTSSGTCVSLVDHGWAGRVKSVTNTHTTSAALFPSDDCLGGPSRIDAGASIGDLGSFVPLSAWVPGRTN
ncbi:MULTISPECIES: peptidase inhibitor family I36 protein [unclassified Streptomyces]|uniref:peptidase inhibitor family I36 protein n=1 Tax=unclassified Streptomyces TaxID=2593676 RepID=UPI00073BA387|nr:MULTISPECIES: peptidase inhibitor family I36 protein [unclassified Streptomyces]ODA74825.1 hypothetical protein APS67_001014 [Streptomyces sp. AVP053U2]